MNYPIKIGGTNLTNSASSSVLSVCNDNYAILLILHRREGKNREGRRYQNGCHKTMSSIYTMSTSSTILLATELFLHNY